MSKLAVLLALLAAGCSSAVKNPWTEATRPSRGAQEAIGTYTAGCLKGAVSLAPDGKGYQLMRLTRGKFYGHPRLVAYVQALGERVARKKLGVLLVGNLGMARGGPTMQGHRSHQIGLDVDIWFWRPDYATKRSLTLAEREQLESPSVVSADQESLVPEYWSPKQAEVLRLAAGFDEVQRIFVHPAIKRELCRVTKDRAWLSKIRPWWGHDDHFHVRLGCPSGEKLCVAQEPVPEGDGCDATLEEWFKPEMKAKMLEPAEPPKMPALPVECDEVLKEV